MPHIEVAKCGKLGIGNLPDLTPNVVQEVLLPLLTFPRAISQVLKDVLHGLVTLQRVLNRRLDSIHRIADTRHEPLLDPLH